MKAIHERKRISRDPAIFNANPNFLHVQNVRPHGRQIESETEGKKSRHQNLESIHDFWNGFDIRKLHKKNSVLHIMMSTYKDRLLSLLHTTLIRHTLPKY
ncbi:MAG: hypothetical protein IPL87_04075 [Candidatus Moraniibacteriota bacterium]|nr:MAG: hypothetical protein IPL87_04075 [Candidatus Moranbacteria bacterium]